MLFQIIADDFREQILEAHGHAGGAYRVIAYQNGNSIPIPRWLGTDPEGILYIGRTAKFTKRVIKFKRAIQRPPGRGHSSCRAYHLAQIIAEKFPIELLFAELFPAADPAQKEKELRLKYIGKYGEVPPLNSQK